MTHEEMERCGRLAVRICWAQLEKRQRCELLVAMWRRSKGTLEEFKMPEEAGPILNSGPAKRMLFHFLRRWASLDPDIEAVILASDQWFARATPEGMKHQEEMDHGAVDRGFTSWVAKGWAERYEAVIATVQTQEDVLLARRIYTRRDRKPFVIDDGEMEVEWIPQSKFRGRQKMYGDFRPENLGENPGEQMSVDQLDEDLARMLDAMKKEKSTTT